MSSDKFYTVVAQRQCDDPYYPLYTDIIRYFKSKEKAIEFARRCRQRTKKHSQPQDCYYVEERTFDDDVEFKETCYILDSSNDEDEDVNEHGVDIKKYTEEMKKNYYYGEDEETYFDENDKEYKQGGMVYVIARKSDKNDKVNEQDNRYL